MRLYAARAMLKGPGGQMYIGTALGGSFLPVFALRLPWGALGPGGHTALGGITSFFNLCPGGHFALGRDFILDFGSAF